MSPPAAADLLAQHGANPFRVSAYRRAADAVARLRRDLGEVLDREGPDAPTALPHIGRGIAAAIVEIVRTSRTQAGSPDESAAP